MCALHEPLLPVDIFLSKLSPGSTLSRTSWPATPSIHVTSILLSAAARVMASRRSVRSGTLMTSTSWNWESVSDTHIGGHGWETDPKGAIEDFGRFSPRGRQVLQRRQVLESCRPEQEEERNKKNEGEDNIAVAENHVQNDARWRPRFLISGMRRGLGFRNRDLMTIMQDGQDMAGGAVQSPLCEEGKCG
jgi:hypothetical protein